MASIAGRARRADQPRSAGIRGCPERLSCASLQLCDRLCNTSKAACMAVARPQYAAGSERRTVTWVQLGALADELRAGRETDARTLATQLDAVADKQQGMRLDLAAMTKELQGQRQNVAALTLQLEGPPSMRRNQI